MLSITERLSRLAADHPDRCLYTFHDASGRIVETYTYGEFDDRTRFVAERLRREHGFRPGDRLLLAYSPGLETLIALVACARAGFVAVPACPPSSLQIEAGIERIAGIAGDCDASGILTDRDGMGHRLPLRCVSTGGMKGIASPDSRDTPGPLALLQYTSGSTREPRGVRVSHENVLHNCAATLDFVPICVSWLPQYHDMGLIGYYLYPMLTGGTTHGFAPVDFLRKPALWLRLIDRYRANHTAAPNFGYEYCLREDKLPEEALDGISLASLRVMLNASEPVSPKTMDRFRERFARCGLAPGALVAAYGLAENTITVSRGGRHAVTVNKDLMQQGILRFEPPSPGHNNQLALASCGHPVQGVDVSIADPGTGRDLGDDRIGEILVSGESRCRGYWGDGGDATGDERLRTGDLGFLHDGELYVCGRQKDVIIVRGANVHPQDIEAAARESVGETRPGSVMALDGGPDAGIVVLVEARRQRIPDPQRIAAAVHAGCFIRPNTIAFVPHGALPKTTSGKPARAAAARMFADGSLPVLASHSFGDEEGPPLARFLRMYALRGDETVPLSRLGIDSLTSVELLAEIKKLLADTGASSLIDEIDGRLLHGMTVAELLALTRLFAAERDQAVSVLGPLLRRKALEQNDADAASMRNDVEEWRAASPSAQGAPESPREIVLTGATGFFGPFLLKALLEKTPWTVHALVRASDEAAAPARIRAAMRRAGLLDRDCERELASRVRTVCGDLAAPSLGWAPATWDALAAQTQAVVHAGARVDYVLSYEALRGANVLGTREMIRFAQSGSPKTFHYLSTTFVHGWAARGVLLEDDDNAAMRELDFGYAQSKWVAEQLVHASAEGGLDARIYRPSLISAASNGRGSRDDVATRLLAFMLAHGIAPDASNQVSFLPADAAAAALASIIADGRPFGRTLHVTVDDYYSMVDVTREITRAYGIPFGYHKTPRFVEEMIRRATKADPVYPLLDFFNRSHAKIEAMRDKRYGNAAYRSARERCGGPPDPDLASTVRYLVSFLSSDGLIPVVSEPADQAPST